MIAISSWKRIYYRVLLTAINTILDVCKTKEGTLCHFPFTYLESVYEKCTKADSDVYWCATTPEYSSDNYGLCDSNCPMESGNHF